MTAKLTPPPKGTTTLADFILWFDRLWRYVTGPTVLVALTTAQKNAIASPSPGLMVFDTTLQKTCVYTSGGWETVTSA